MSAGIATLSRQRTAPSNSQSAGMSHSNTGTPDFTSGSCTRFIRTPHREAVSGVVPAAACSPPGWRGKIRTSDDAQ